MRTAVAYLCLAMAPVSAVAQQTVMYVQYTFNKAGMNPAASGTDRNRKHYYAFGGGRQWMAFDNAPKTHFVNASYTLKPPRSYRRWQNFGIYADNDDTGLLGNIGAYGTYAVHMLMTKKLVLSLGAFAGVRVFERSTGFFDGNDPAVQKSRTSVITYPDIIPGVRLSNDIFFLDVSARQLTINRQKSFTGQQIGGPSILFPELYAAYGVRRSLSEQMILLPSVALHLPLPGVPTIDGTIMMYFANRVGLGVAARNLSFVSGILQVRFFESLSAGFAYSYPINNTRYASPNSYELMIGIVPYGMDAHPVGKHSVARCPSLSY
jgi:type IX secretion system PorP/SprF family membrane protein